MHIFKKKKDKVSTYIFKKQLEDILSFVTLESVLSKDDKFAIWLISTEEYHMNEAAWIEVHNLQVVQCNLG